MLIFMILTSIMSMFLNNVIILWFFMEINNFIFLFYLSYFINNKKMIFTYFLVQMISSFLLIFSLLINNFFLFSNNYFVSLLMSLSLMIKLGAPPFHLWLIMVSLYMNWIMIFLLLTIQKLIPFVLFSLVYMNFFIFMVFVLMCMLIPPFMMLNSLNFKKLIVYSSINQTGWMMMLIYFYNYLWLFYFLVYSFSLFIILGLISLNKLYNNYLLIKMSFFSKLLSLVSMINISGVPPLSFFIYKWFSVFIFIENMIFNIIVLLMIFSSLVMLYIYMNMLINIVLIWSVNSKFILYYCSNYNEFFFFLMLLFLVSFIMIII